MRRIKGFFWHWLMSHESIFCCLCHWSFCVLVFLLCKSCFFVVISSFVFWRGLSKFFLFSLPQVNGHRCVNFGCTHPIDGLFWSLPIYLLGLFSKYECWVIDLIMSSYIIFFGGCHLPFFIKRFHITMKCKNQFIWLIFKMKFVW